MKMNDRVLEREIWGGGKADNCGSAGRGDVDQVQGQAKAKWASG